MKHNYIIFAISFSFLGLHAMEMDNKPGWLELCKDPHKKQHLTTVYQDFCKKRFDNTKTLAALGWTPMVSWGLLVPDKAAFIKKYPVKCVIFGIGSVCFAAEQTRRLIKYNERNQAVSQGKLDYLYDDVKEQLGNPYTERDMQNRFKVISFAKNAKSELKLRRDTIDISTIKGIEKALSGNYRAYSDHDRVKYGPFTLAYLKIKTDLKLMIKGIKDSIQ